MTRVVLLGAGGHARETLDILRECEAAGQAVDVLGFVDENPSRHGTSIDGRRVLGGFDWFDGHPRAGLAVVAASGSPQTCRRFVDLASARQLDFATVISPRAAISRGATIGHGAIVFPNVIVNTGARIGDHVILNVAVTVSHDSEVGSFTNINPGVHLAGNVTVGTGCYIGMGANVIQAITIGAACTIGAGAVVVRDLPDGVTAVGVPARIVRRTAPPAE